jgi:hypothetical protein
MRRTLIHIVPIADERDHDERDDCWCDPTVERTARAKIVTHNAADMREEYEKITGDALPGKAWMCVKNKVPMEFDY